MPQPSLSRRALIAIAAAAGVTPLARSAHAVEAGLRRTIPSSGESLTALGIGTSRRYEVEPVADKVAPLAQAVDRFLSLGGTVIDTAPSYGTAEDVLGRIFSGGIERDRVFLASKVSASGREAARAQIERSFARMRTDRIDLIAVHNLIDIDANLAILRDLKAQGRIRYVGVTVWLDRQFADLEAVMRREALDFVQVNYAIDARAAAERILPLARERGMAVMVNVPFGRDRLFAAVKDRPLPDWAAAIDCRSWAQIFLKYVLAHEAVTCPIPGMAKAAYVEDNMGALQGRLPDRDERETMERYIDAL